MERVMRYVKALRALKAAGLDAGIHRDDWNVPAIYVYGTIQLPK